MYEDKISSSRKKSFFFKNVKPLLGSFFQKAQISFGALVLSKLESFETFFQGPALETKEKGLVNSFKTVWHQALDGQDIFP